MVVITLLCVTRNVMIGGIMRSTDAAAAAPALDIPELVICERAAGNVFSCSLYI